MSKPTSTIRIPPALSVLAAVVLLSSGLAGLNSYQKWDNAQQDTIAASTKNMQSMADYRLKVPAILKLLNVGVDLNTSECKKSFDVAKNVVAHDLVTTHTGSGLRIEQEHAQLLSEQRAQVLLSCAGGDIQKAYDWMQAINTLDANIPHLEGLTKYELGMVRSNLHKKLYPPRPLYEHTTTPG